MKVLLSAIGGLLVGASTTAIACAAAVYLALSQERSVDLAGIVQAIYQSSGGIEFSLNVGLGWLGFLLPVIGLVIGILVGAVSQVRPRRAPALGRA